MRPNRFIYLRLQAMFLGFGLCGWALSAYGQETDIVSEEAEQKTEQTTEQKKTDQAQEPVKEPISELVSKTKGRPQVPQPSSADIGGLPPKSTEIYPQQQYKQDKKQCKRKKGKWIQTEKGLEGCLVKGKKEGLWIFKEGAFIQGVISFKNNVFDGDLWSFSLEGRAIEQVTYRQGKKEGAFRKWGPGGQLKSVSYYRDDQKDGPSFEWHARSCIPAHKGAYKAGKKHGPWATWYHTGAYQEKGSYVDGVKQGTWSFYHQEGNKIKEGVMVDGKEDGTWQEWLHTGQKWRDSEFKQGIRQGEDELNCLKQNGSWLVDHKERVESCQRFSYQTIIAQKTYYENGALLRRESYNLQGEKTGLTQSFHPSGELLVEGQMLGGRPEGTFTYLKPSGEPMGPSSIINQGTGKWTAYHASGAVAEQGEWMLGLPTGEWKTFYDHGGLESTMSYREGRRQGRYVRYYRDGTIELEGDFQENARQGLWKFYYTNGQVAVEANFVDSARSGPWKEWYWLSSPKVQGEYTNNQRSGTWLEYHNNGELSAQGSYAQDRKSGKWKQNWYTGSHWRELEFTSGISDDPDETQCESIRGQWTAELKERYAGCQVCRVVADGSHKLVKMGAWRWWHPNGELEREGQFDEDQAHGSWQEYNREGKLILSGEYDRGKRIGLWRGFYPEGPRQYEGRFDDTGAEQGQWTTYYKAGGIESQGQYEHGRRVGLWIWWSRQGNLSQIGMFNTLQSASQSEKALKPLQDQKEIQDKDQASERDQDSSKSAHKQIEQRIGLWLSWHKNCQLKTAGYYQHGEREGRWRWWKANGEGWRAENYIKSRSQGRQAIPKRILLKQSEQLRTLCQKQSAQKSIAVKKLEEILFSEISEKPNEKPHKATGEVPNNQPDVRPSQIKDDSNKNSINE